MIWALLATFLLSKPAWVQAVALGLSTGLFAIAAAEANNRDPALDDTLVMLLVWGSVTAVLYFVGFSLQTRGGALSDHSAPAWLYVLYAVVWLVGLAAAVMALLGEGGFTVAILAIVPLVLLAPAALYGIRHVTHRAAT